MPVGPFASVLVCKKRMWPASGASDASINARQCGKTFTTQSIEESKSLDLRTTEDTTSKTDLAKAARI